MRHFSPPPPPPADAAPVLEELVTLRVREKVQSDLRQDRQELLNTMERSMQGMERSMQGMERSMQGIGNSLSDKIGGVEKNLNIKIDSSKTETSLQAAAYALAGATLAVSALGFVFEKKVAVVDVKPAPT